MNLTHITLKVETVNKVLAYLDTRPHGEVRAIIDTIVGEATKPAPEAPSPEGGEQCKSDQ